MRPPGPISFGSCIAQVTRSGRKCDSFVGPPGALPKVRLLLHVRTEPPVLGISLMPPQLRSATQERRKSGATELASRVIAIVFSPVE